MADEDRGDAQRRPVPEAAGRGGLRDREGAEDAKPAVLRDATFTVREGLLYRACRTGAIWMNKLFFSCLILLGLWVIAAYAGEVESCTRSVRVEGGADAGERVQCSPFLTPTAKYLAGMAAVSFALSIAFGLLGLMVGKDIVQAAKAAEEVGARREP